MTTPPQTHQEAMRSIARLHRILEASKLLSSTLDLAELTSIILRIIHDEVGMDRGTVFVLERGRRTLHSLVAQGIEGKEIIVPIRNGIEGTVASTGEIIDFNDAISNPH